MIGRLAGRVAGRAADHVLIDVGGVGYVVHVSERTLAALPGEGEAAALWTELLVREDLLQLFGFATPAERDWHRLLIGVQGIGARASLAILGALGPEGLARAIALGDWASVKAAPGVGPKIAQRVVNELKGRAPAMMAAGTHPTAAAGSRATPGAAAPHRGGASGAAQEGAKAGASPEAEAMSALAHLGYAPSEAAGAVAEAARDAPDAETPALIRAALRRLAPQG